jgi:alpha-L-fucosidase
LSQGDTPNSIYAVCLAWPEKEVVVRAVGLRNLPDTAITAVRMLGSKDAIRWRRTDEGLHLSVPGEKPCRHAFVYRIDTQPPARK